MANLLAVQRAKVKNRANRRHMILNPYAGVRCNAMRYLACLAAIALAALCSGCIVLPMPGVLAKPHNKFAGKVGDRDSSAPLRPGLSNQDDVEKILGKPDYVIDVDKNKCLQNWYYWDGHTDLVGVWVWFVPVHGRQIQPITREYELEIDFDGHGQAEKFVMTK